MRLINTQTLQLELFYSPVQPYAILSHTWTDDEVTFDDMRNLATARLKKAFGKIENACKMAIDDGIEYLWVDTCCIDKASSAELSEAINSMFRWYKNSLVCYAFLSDLPPSRVYNLLDFKQCKWFTRGWTLQELIAPAKLIFFNCEWGLVGDKVELTEIIETITGIDQEVLVDSSLLSSVALARRMSWASARQTTRIEDLAYCLMGIFDINMPMLYGEGLRSFIRLQEEILRSTTDLSLFAWQAQDIMGFRGLLAESPAEFRSAGRFVPSNTQFRFRGEISMTNKGIKIDIALHYVGDQTYVLDTQCCRQGSSVGIGVYLRRALDTYYRKSPHLTTTSGNMTQNLPAPIFLATSTDEHLMRTMFDDQRSPRIHIEFPESHIYYVHNITGVPEIYWQAHESAFAMRGLDRFTCFVRFTISVHISEQPSDLLSTVGKSTQVILFCEFSKKNDLRVNLFQEDLFRETSKPEGFLDPFEKVERYGNLGHPFSLSVLSFKDNQTRQLSIRNLDGRHNYLITAKPRLVGPVQSSQSRVIVTIEPEI